MYVAQHRFCTPVLVAAFTGRSLGTERQVERPTTTPRSALVISVVRDLDGLDGICALTCRAEVARDVGTFCELGVIGGDEDSRAVIGCTPQGGQDESAVLGVEC